MRYLLATLLAALVMSLPGVAGAKVCYHCKNDKPVKYVCAHSDSFAARKNAKALGCDFSSYSSICKCGAWVGSKANASFVDWALTRLSR
jgi:hypothetical protein